MVEEMALLEPRAFRDFERRGHDRAARTYGDFLGPVTAGAIGPLLDAAAVGPGARVLDVATGPGVVAAVAASRGARTVGVDLSPKMIAAARARHPDLDVRVGDAEQLPFDEASVDAVVCNFGLGHFGHPERVALELVRVLAPGGRAAVSWWDGVARTRISGVFFDAIAQAGMVVVPAVPAGPPFFRFSDPAELRALLTIAGLQDVTVRTLRWTHRLASADAWWAGGLASLVRVSAIVLAQPPTVQRRIRSAFDRLIQPYRTPDAFIVPVAAQLASGRKP
jgi:SAM-dependent methyltransferase